MSLLEDDAALAQARLAAIIESSDDAIISKTLEGIITSWNLGAEKIFGYTAAEAIGKSITLIVPEDRLPEEADVLARLRRGEKIDHFETIRRTKDGRLLHISVTVSPIKGLRGTIVGASKVARDITERKLIEGERQKWLSREQVARRDAERAVQARDEFLAMVSHELRSPLNAIVGWAHLLQTGELDPSRVERAVDAIARNAKIQSQLISDLLDAQSLASGKVRLNVQPTDLALVVEAALDTIRPSAEAKQVTLKPRLRVTTAVVPGDADRLQQVIWNLLSNAVKFTPEHGEITITLTESASDVEILVQDTGPGIRPEFLPFVFERFRQDSATGQRTGGLGLGLSIVRHLVELHGGTVAASNGEDAGAVFLVRLPRLRRETVQALRDDAPVSDDAARGTDRTALQGVRVLVVDDEPESREVVAAVLALHGAEVTLAGSAEEALNLLGRTQAHVIVSDISMPGQDGYALMQAIRALPEAEGGQTPAIALTAAVTTQDRLRALRSGFQFHLPKPVAPAELIQAIVSVLG